VTVKEVVKLIFEDKFSHFVKKQQFKLIISKPYYSRLDTRVNSKE